MAIPEFFDNYHLPPGDHECTLEEIEERFLFTEIRQNKWDQFKRMIQRMSELGLKPEQVLINGSFVTGRTEPGDVDFAALILPEVVKKALAEAPDDHDRGGISLFLTKENQSALRDLFGAHLLVADTEDMLNGWGNIFRYGQHGKLREPDPQKDPEWVRRPTAKGILKVIIN